MNVFKSDAQGFLLGERLLDSNREIQAGQDRAMPVLRAIRSDVRIIARALGVTASIPGRGQGGNGARGSAARGPGSRTPGAGPASPVGRGGAAAGGRSAGAQPRDSAGRFIARTAVAAAARGGPSDRDARGRFMPVDGGSKGGGGALLRVSDGLHRMSVALGSIDNVDPAVNAAKEVADVVAPIGRGLGGLFGRTAERRKERWYSRIWKALTARGKPAEQPLAGGSSGNRLFGGLLPSVGDLLPLLGRVLTRVFAPVAAIWGAFELGQWIGRQVSDWLVKSGLQDRLFNAFDSIRDTVVGAFRSIPEKVSALFAGIDAAIRKVPVVGDAYAAATGAIQASVVDAQRGYADESAGGSSAAAGSVQTAGEVAGRLAAQVVAGFDAARGQESNAPEPAGVAQRAARVAGGAVGRLAGLGQNAMAVLQAGRGVGLSGVELANFMGQNAHESAGFTRLSENLNYGSVRRIRAVFGANKTIAGMSDAQLQGFVNNPEGLGNAVYGGRLGNAADGDGYKFRGRGFVQLTGQANYAAAGKALGLDLVGNPDLASDPAVAARISAWYWQNRVASRGAGADVRAATRAINGGEIGLADRKARVAEWQAKLTTSAGNPLAATPALPGGAAANIPSAVPTAIPKPPEVREPPERLNSAGDRGRPQVTVNMPDRLGQDVGDRAIAHIVSGGIGST